jgi:hypothetical protein
MISYGDRPNDFESVSKCTLLVSHPSFPDLICSQDFRNKFGSLHQNFTPNREREVFSTFLLLVSLAASDHFPVHFTAVTDTRRTAKIISNGLLFPSYLLCLDYPTLISFISTRYYHQGESPESSINVTIWPLSSPRATHSGPSIHGHHLLPDRIYLFVRIRWSLHIVSPNTLCSIR